MEWCGTSGNCPASTSVHSCPAIVRPEDMRVAEVRDRREDAGRVIRRRRKPCDRVAWEHGAGEIRAPSGRRRRRFGRIRRSLCRHRYDGYRSARFRSR